MGKRIKKLKKIRLHREGTDQLLYGGIGIALARQNQLTQRAAAQQYAAEAGQHHR